MPINAVLSASIVGLGRSKMLSDYNYASVQGLHGGVGTLYPGAAFSVYGRLYQVIVNRSGGDLNFGDAVSLNLGDANESGSLQASSTGAVIVTDDTQYPDSRGDESYPSRVVVTAGAMATTANQQIRNVRGHVVAAGASTLTVEVARPSEGPGGTDITGPDVFTGPPDNTYKYGLFVPYEVVKAAIGALATSLVQGCVVSTVITNNYFGIIQLPFGDGVAKVDGTTGLVVGDFLIPDAAAGVLSKWAVGAPDANGVTRENFVCARVLDPYTNNGVGLRHVQFINRGAAMYPFPIL